MKKKRTWFAAEKAAPKLETYPRCWEDTWRDECAHRIDAARRVDLKALDDEALLDELQRVIDQVLDPHFVIHFQLTWPHMVGMYELVRCCEELLGWDLPRAMTLVTGLSSATTRATFEIEAIDGKSELPASTRRTAVRHVELGAVTARVQAVRAGGGGHEATGRPLEQPAPRARLGPEDFVETGEVWRRYTLFSRAL